MDYSVFNTLLDAVFVVNEEKKLVYANEAAANLVGMSLKRLKRGTDMEQFFQTDPPIFLPSMRQIQTPTPYKELGFSNKNGSGFIQITIQPTPYGEGDKGPAEWVVFARDISLEMRLQAKYKLEAIAKDQALEKVEQGQYDPLTGIFHKGIFTEKFHELFANAKQNKLPLYMCIFDLDNFKKVNDNHGHAAGDYVLKEMAQIISASIRKRDLFARFGGEEFVIILSSANFDDAIMVCERICRLVASHHFIWQATRLAVTISMGVGQVEETVRSPDEFFALVDSATYESKRKGKNQVTVAGKSI